MKKVNLLVLAILALGCMLTSCRKQNMIAADADQLAPQEQLTNSISSIGTEKPCLGKMQPDCLCPDVYEPVCGCDGVTYSSSCTAFCAGVLQYKPYPCGCLGRPQSYCVCPDVYDPVCGCNGVTYSNSCAADCAGVLIYTQGGCNGESRTAFGSLRPW